MVGEVELQRVDIGVQALRTRAPAPSPGEPRSERSCEPPPAREPTWLLFLAGWLFASAVFGTLRRAAGGGGESWPLADLPPGPPLVDELRAGPAEVDLARAPPRVLRRLPGVGVRRAAEVAELRWSRPPGAPLELQAVHGIGPRTEARVRAWLAERERERGARR